MLITDKELNLIVNNPRNYNTGRRYFHNDNIDEISIDYDSLGEEYTIEGKVSVGNYENECSITVDKNNKIIDYDCDCFWCDSDSACGHVGAILLKVQELSPDNFPYTYKKGSIQSPYIQQLLKIQKAREEHIMNMHFNETRSLINDFKENKANDFNLIKFERKFDIDIELNNEYGPELKFKVGNDKKYVIKFIPDFIKAVDNNGYIKYGKQLAFKHSEKVFSDEALKIIEMMRYCFIINERNNDYFYGNRITNTIKINSDNIDVIYNCLNELDLDSIYIGKMTYLPTIRISNQGDYYIFNIDELEDICGNNALYHIEEKAILKCDLDEEQKAVKFINNICEKNELFLAKKDIDDFEKYILNDIKDYFNFVGDKLPTDVIDDEVLTLFGDINEIEQVKVYLESKRENETVYSFNHDGQKTSIDFDFIEDYLKDISDVIDEENHCMYLNLENEKTYTFLNAGLPFLANYCEIMVSDALQKIGKKNQFNINIGVTIENDLLAIDVDSIDIPKEELANVLKSYQRKKKFHRLKNGKLLYLESDELEELDEFMNDYNLKANMLEDGHLDMNIYRAFSVDNKADISKNLNFNRSDIFKDTIENFKNVKNQNYSLDDNYQIILRDYQKFGYQWLQAISNYGFGGILADDMGLGKTLQMIALLDQNKQDGKTSMVICPSSLLLNWQDEIKKFSKTLTCTCVHGALSERKLAMKSFGHADVLITTYDYMRRDYKLYEDYQFEYVILDEAQYIKNPKTKNASSVKSLNAKHRFALTGTPIENSLAELWSIFDFLMPDYLYNYHYFKTNYETPIVKNHDENKQQELKKLITPFILRRNKKDVITELPEKIEKILSLEFTNEEHKLYLANLVQVNKELQEQLHYDNVDRIAILAMLTRLRQICCEPRVLYENITNISSKLEGCLDLIRNFLGNKQKVLLFSSFTSVLDLIGTELSKEGISYYVLDGSTSKEERHRLVNQFQNDDTTVFLISLKAGGTGLNLTAAQAVIHFDPWWNMSAQNQATDRAHRIGQKNIVTVYKLVMKDSVEEKILELQNKKKNLADSFVENNDGSITTMSTKDIIDLFKM